MVQLDRRGDVSQVGHRRDRVPEPRILLGCTEAVDELARPAAAERGGWTVAACRMPVLEQVFVGRVHAGPDDGHLDPRVDHQRP